MLHSRRTLLAGAALSVGFGVSVANAQATTVALVPDQSTVAPGGDVQIDVFVENVDNLRAYEIRLEVTGGDSGSLAASDVFVDSGRADFVFVGDPDVQCPTQLASLLVSCASGFEAGVDVGATPAYLGTYVFTASPDAAGTFNLDFRPSPDTALFDSGFDEITPIAFEPVSVPVELPTIEAIELFYSDRFADEVDPSKAAMATGASYEANISNYTEGITGLLVEFDRQVSLPDPPGAAFSFEWTGETDTTFTPITVEPTVTISVGPNDRTVVTLTFEDLAIKNRWLRTTIAADLITTPGATLDGELSGNPAMFPSGDGIAGGDSVFYFGNKVADVTGDRKTTGDDVLEVRDSQQGPFVPVPITNVYDVDKSGFVIGDDVLRTRESQTGPFVQLPSLAVP